MSGDPDEWLVTFADPIRAQSVIDRFISNAYDLVIDSESYRNRLKPTLAKERRAWVHTFCKPTADACGSIPEDTSDTSLCGLNTA